MSARRVTLRELGIRWTYWFCAFGFLAVGIVAIYAVRFEPEGKVTLLSGGMMFTLLGVLAILWPILRIREAQGLRPMPHGTQSFPGGVFVPVSRTKLWICFLGGSIMCISVVAILMTKSTVDESVVKGGLALAVYVGIAGQFIYYNFKQKPGLTLSAEGILWQGFLMAPCFVRWSQIEHAKIYFHQEKYSKSKSFGLALRDLDQLDIGKGMRNKLTEHFKRHGYHLRFSAESLLESLEAVEFAVSYYRQHPERRDELTCGAAFSRIMSFESEENLLQNIATKFS